MSIEPATLIAEQTATMILADAIIDIATGLAENSDDPRMIDAVVGAVRDAIDRVSTPFVSADNNLLGSDERARAVGLARDRARAVAEMIEVACRNRMAAQMGPEH